MKKPLTSDLIETNPLTSRQETPSLNWHVANELGVVIPRPRLASCQVGDECAIVSLFRLHCFF